MSRGQAIALALFVTLLWSSSWVLIKWGLAGLPPLTFAGLRYFLAFLILAVTLGFTKWREAFGLSGRDYAQIAGLGVSLYFFTQGAQFLSLKYFPAVLPALVINLAPVVILFSAWPILNERPRALQILGVFICAAGALIYFANRIGDADVMTWHLAIPVAGMFANAAAALFGRALNRGRRIDAKLVTTLSMGLGSILLLLTGAAIEEFPRLGSEQWAILAWLVVVNTSLAFTWWNQSLQVLTSVESGVINNTMIVQVAVFAWVFLGEALTYSEIAALTLILAGVLAVQFRRYAGKAHAR